ncbi:MAG: hypothetical protein ACREXS_17600 [Gammaproteobacteria bacterium]
MAVITKTIQPGEKSNEVTAIQKGLISLGAVIASGELFTATTAGTFGPSTQAAMVALYARFGFGQFGPPVFNASVGRLLNIAVGADVGNSAALQKAVRESFAAIQTPPVSFPDELARLARYASIARDFTTARKIVDLIPDNSSAVEEKRKIAAIVKQSTQQPPTPEVLNGSTTLCQRGGCL